MGERFANKLTDDADLPDFGKGTLDVLDVGQTLVQVGLDHVVALRVAFGDGSEDPATTQSRAGRRHILAKVRRIYF